LKQRQVHGWSPIASVGDIALIESAEGDPYVPEADQVGTLWKLLDASAAAANAYRYDAYGVPRSVSESFTNPFRFAGKPLDPDPALYHSAARPYAPKVGRFLTHGSGYSNEDPVGSPSPQPPVTITTRPGLIDRVTECIEALEVPLVSLADCFGVYTFKSKILSFIHHERGVHGKISTELPANWEGGYDHWTGAVIFRKEPSCETLLHEVVHAYDDYHDVTGWFTPGNAWKRERFAWTFNAVYGQIRLWQNYARALANAAPGSRECFDEIMTFHEYLPNAPVGYPGYETEFHWYTDYHIEEWARDLMFLTVADFDRMWLELGLRVSCWCIWKSIKPLIDRAVGGTCCVSCPSGNYF
jgi:RHS repeat-associated protein